MKDTLKKLSRKKVIISAILVILFVLMIGLITVLKPVNKTIKISKVLTNTKTLSASVIDGVFEGVTSNNYDEIKYQIKVNKDDSDTAIVTASLTSEENKYARFKEIKDGVVTNNGKEITITTTRSNITITVIVENAPYGVTINPKININSEDETKSKINVDPVTITGKSVEGIVSDENGTLFSGIELSLLKNGTEVKRTYTKEDGKYVFSLGDLDTYEVRIAETKYKLVRYTEETTDQNRRVLNLVIKEVEPFTLNIKKTISKLDLVVNGKKEVFNYDDETKVVKVIKNAKTIEGSIYYNISIKNEGEVKGTVAVLKDIIPDGLSFDETKNPGWTKEDNYLFYTPLEGTELNAFEKTSAKLVLDIAKTDEAKSYINKAIASGDDYKYIVYYLNGNVYKEEYVINSEKIENIDPHVENFAGWYTDRNYTNKYNFDNAVTKDIALYGKIDNNKFNVMFIDINPNNNSQTILDIKEVPEGESVDLVDHPEYNGYTFKCFTLNGTCYNDEEIVSDTELYTSYTINNYDIEYDLDDGTVAAANPTSYTVKDTFTLNNPTKEGFTFLGWTGTGLSDVTETVTVPVGSTGKRTYTAHYEINRSTLTIDPNGGAYESNTSLVTFTENFGTLKVLSESERRGYNFLRYDHDGGGTYNNLTYLFDNDDATLTAIYEIINYRINYENITTEERDFLRNKTTYNVETDTFTLCNPNTRLDNEGNNYQDFLGWDDGNGNVSLIVTIPKGSIGDRTYTAVWRENQDDYAIRYNLHEGTLEAGKSNPNTYTRQTETFTLNNPNKNGYTFTGWIGTGLTNATKTVTIPKGSSGDRDYEANYEVIPYTISYEGITEEEKAALRNKTDYNIETPTFSINNPSREGYNFLGWSGTGITDKSTSVSVPQGSTGDRTYIANWELISYSLTYTLNGGDYEAGKSNPDKYYVTSDPITLNNPSKTGYTFKGWSGTDLTGNENTTVVIPTGSQGHRSFLANYTPITYHIYYDYDEGNLPSGVTNPDTYTIESAEITFNSPEKEGYTFTHYTSGNNIITSIPTGSTGDYYLKANYEINHYTVNYYNESIQFATETVDWMETANKPVNDPEKAHNIFLYWSEDNINEYDFSTKITANKNLYAVYEEVLAPVITLNPTLDEITNKTWVCSDSSNSDCGVLVTITNNENLLDTTGYELYYKIGDNSPVLYTEPFKVYENTTITAFAKKNNIYSENTSKDVVNVDSIAPTINNPATGAMSFNMSVSGTAQDADSGVKQFTLYVKEKNALAFDDTLTYTSEVFDGIKDHAENYDHTFYGVQDNTEYIVKIVAVDYVGNVSEKEVEVTTHPYVARVVGKNNMLWYTVDPDTKEFVIEDGKEFLMFDSIQAAVDYCAEVQCTIQTNPIYPVVNESVTIGQNQNITIDLDGRIITSDENATFINNGELHIVDRNPREVNGEHESIGKVTNPTGKAVINNKKFVLGDGSSEASETFIYPELDRPIIEGYQTAIEQNDTFYFFDGKLVSDTIALIDSGEDPITQYSYNVVITGENDKHIGTLSIVDDPEARIKSTYYTKLKVNTGDNAFDSSRTGTMTTENTRILSKIKQCADYGFVYDAVNNEIYSGNSTTANTTAKSYIKLDLTEESEDLIIMFDAFADTAGANSYGYISVSESLSDNGTEIFRITGNSIYRTKIYYLEKGKVYYIYFGFVKAYSDINAYEMFKVSNFTILGERESTSNFTLFHDTSNYPFVQDDNGKYNSSNQDDDYSYSHSYAIFDLRGETDQVNLIINTSVSSRDGIDIGYVYLSEDQNFHEYSNTSGRYLYDSGEVSERLTYIPLTPGIINYVHFGYYHKNVVVGTNTFTINSIAIYKPGATSDIIEDFTLYHNDTDTYHFTKGYDSYYLKSTNNKTGILSNVKLNSTNDGYAFNGNGYVLFDGGINDTALTSETVELEFSTTSTGNAVYYMGSNKEKISIGVWNSKIFVANISSNIPKSYTIPSDWADGNRHMITVVSNEGVYDAYFDGVLMTKSSDTGSFQTGLNGSTYLGCRSSGNYFNGTIYSVKVFDKALSEEELIHNPTEGIILDLDASNSLYPIHGYISNNRGVVNTNAHSYIKIDLTNVDEDKYLYVNTKISSELNGDYGIIQVTNSSDYPTDSNGVFLKISGDLDNQSGVIKLNKNQVNYVHFMYTKNNTRNYYSDSFLIKEIKYCNTIEDAYSITDSSIYKNPNYYFEKPVFNETVDTVEMLKNITLDSTLIVPEEKEVILDLNGFTLTSNKNDYVIKNNGKLTIIDSDYTDRIQTNIDYKTEQARLFEEAKAKYFEDLAEYQEYVGTCDECTGPSDEYKLDHITEYASDYGINLNDESRITKFEYDTNDASQEFDASIDGIYKIELWGASGGNGWTSAGGNGYCTGGAGAYTSGLINLNSNSKLYVFVGAKGESGDRGKGVKSASFNGGGTGGYGGGDDNAGSGGGATDVRLTDGLWNNPESLNSRIMVAAGGGGASCISNSNTTVSNRSGGTLSILSTSVAAWDRSCSFSSVTQTSGNTFGIGMNSPQNESGHAAGGGGGGYYGGTYCISGNFYSAGSGGTSYISGYTGTVAVESESSSSPRLDSHNQICTNDSALIDNTCSIHYSGKTFIDTVMKSGNEEMPTYDGDSTMTGNSDNGYAKITFIISTEDYNNIKSNIPKTYTVKEEPVFKNYIYDVDMSNKDTITPQDDPSYNQIVDETINGNITSTIYDVILNEQYATLNLDAGNISINSNSKNAIINRGNLILGAKCVINARNSDSIAIFNESNGDITSSGGTINAIGSNSIGLLNRSSDSIISNLNINTSTTNSFGIKNEALTNVIFDNISVNGSGTGFREFSSGDTIVQNSNFKSTSSYSFVCAGQARASKLTINSSNFNGEFYSQISPRIVTINNSSLTTINNYSGNINVNESYINYFDNKGDATITRSTITNSDMAINNRGGHGTYLGQVKAKMLIKDSEMYYTGSSADVYLISNNDYLTIDNVKINNNGDVRAKAIYNTNVGYNDYDGELPDVHGIVNILGNTLIDARFNTAIYNNSTVVLGSIDNASSGDVYSYSYTGKQEVFTAPKDGIYKLEAWGAEGGNSYNYSCYMGSCSNYFRGGLGAYASGTIELHAGDKLYIHVGGPGKSGGQIASISARYGSYNGGGYDTARMNDWSNGSGGGATDISLSSEDNVWSYDNGIVMSKRSDASYNQRILIAGGGGGAKNDNLTYGGYPIDPSTSRLGYGYGRGGGGYYGGTDARGGSSYASDTLDNIVLKNGTEVMPGYYASENIVGNSGAGYAKVTLLSSSSLDTVELLPRIYANTTGITGPGKLYFYDGTINAKTAVDADIQVVPDNYDIYNSLDENSNEKMILVANSDSRPVPSGEEEFVCKIGNAKYTTIQNALDASNNGDTIELLVNIEQQNKIVIPSDKQITIDYKGHTVKSYVSDYLYENHSNLTIKDSENTKNKNVFMGDKYIYNDGTININNLFIDNSKYVVYTIENKGIAVMNDVKIEIGNHSESNKYGIYNDETATMTITNSEFRAFGNNRMFNNYGTLNIKDTPLISNNSAPLVKNNEQGTAILDNTDLRHENANNSYGMYLIDNYGNATIKNLTDNIFIIPNSGVLTLENNTFTDGTINNDGLLIINSGTYNNIFNIRGTGKQIDSTEDLYSFIMHDGTINTKVNREGSGITNIEAGTINVTNDIAINNSGTGTINLGIHDNFADTKVNTRPIISGKSYGIYTSNPSLKVNFYDGIISGQKSYNVTIENIETGYSIKREYDATNDIETKYLTNEPMFINETQNITYSSIDEFNSAITNSLINNGDLIKVYRDITVSNLDDTITIPNGLSITFDVNGKVVDKNNETLFTNNGTLNVVDSDNSKGLIDSTLGNVFINNGTLSISSGKFTSEQASYETEVIKNNENATLNISGGTFTKYYDMLNDRLTNSGSILNNSGTATVTNGTFISNGTYIIQGPSIYHFSAVFDNTETGILNVTGGDYDGINGKLLNHETWQNPNSSYVNKGALIYNAGTATIKDITANQSLIGENSGTISFDNLTMNHIVQIVHNRFGWIYGSNHNLINTGSVTFDNSNFEIYNSFIENRGGDVTINNTVVDKINNGIKLSNGDENNSLQKNSHLIRNKYNAGSSNSITITDSELYNRGTGEIIDNFGSVTIEDSTLEAFNNNVINGSSSILIVDNSNIISDKGIAINVTSSSTVDVFNNSSVISKDGNAININASTLIVGKALSEDNTVSQTYPIIKGTTYGINSTNGTFRFFDGILYGKTATVNGVINTIEDGYSLVHGTEDDYNTTILDRVPIIQNITQATPQDEKKYYNLKDAFYYASNGDTLQMLANYSNLPTDETIVNNNSVVLDLNGWFIKQSNDILITNNGTLTIIDSSNGNAGSIQAISGSKTFDNNGTINLIDANVTTSFGVLIFMNNSGSTLNIKDEGVVNSTTGSLLIDNSGTFNIKNGAYLHNNNGYMINNKNILNIIDLNNDDDPNTSSNLKAPWIYGEGSGEGGGAYESGQEFIKGNASIYTTAGSITNIYGGIFNNGYTYDTGSPDSSRILQNYGTTTIKNLDNYSFIVGYNFGTLTIENSHFYNARSAFLIGKTGVYTIKNVVIDVTHYGGWDVSGEVRMAIGQADIDNLTVSMRDNSCQHGALLYVRGDTTIKNSSISTCLTSDAYYSIYNASNLSIENTTISGNRSIGNDGTIVFDSTDVINSNVAIVNGNAGKIDINNNSSIHSTSGNAINNYGTLNVNDTAEIIATSGSGVNLLNNGIINVGEIGGVPSQSSPYIEGSTFGIYRNGQSQSINFYDGLVVGQTGPNAIYGGVTNVEAGYETEDIVVDDNGVQKHNEYLVVSASSVGIAKVGNYTFAAVGSISSSDALQNAINFATSGNTVRDVDLIANVDLVNDEVNIISPLPVTINMNGFGINYNSTYYLSPNITLNTNSIGGNISRIIADIFDLSYNPVDVIIYEMSDGEKLDATETYTLYKDGELVKLSKEELGKYSYKGNNKDLVPIKGRLYINNLSKGSYRLESSDNRYIEFSIDDDGHLSGNVAENTNNSSSTESIAKSEAELILTIQTGIKKYYYWLAILPILVVLFIFMKKSKNRYISE